MPRSLNRSVLLCNSTIRPQQRSGIREDNREYRRHPRRVRASLLADNPQEDSRRADGTIYESLRARWPERCSHQGNIRMIPTLSEAALTDPLSGMEEVIKEFLVECNEGLDRFDCDLVALEKEPASRDLLDSIFRAIHTIKGTSGVLGYEKLVAVSHVGENVLSHMRDGTLLLSPEITTALLTMADSLRQILRQIALDGTEGDCDCCSVVARLAAVLKEPQSIPPTKTAMPADDGQTVARENHADDVPAKAKEETSVPLLGEILVASQGCKDGDVQTAVQLQEEGDPRPLGEIMVANQA